MQDIGAVLLSAGADDQIRQADPVLAPDEAGAFFAPYIEAPGGVVSRPLVDVPPAVLAVAVRQGDRRPTTRALIETAAATPI